MPKINLRDIKLKQDKPIGNGKFGDIYLISEIFD